MPGCFIIKQAALSSGSYWQPEGSCKIAQHHRVGAAEQESR